MFDAKTDLAPAPSNPFGLDQRRLDSSEHGKPVPYLAGEARLGITFLSDAYDFRCYPVKRKMGKSKQTTGYLYVASFAGAVCLGPVDTLHEIWVDDELAWSGPISRTTDCAAITVEGRGPLAFYWGTDGQSADADLATSGVTHPGYGGVCYAVFKDWVLGENRTNVPNVEFVVTRIPAVDWMSGDEALNGEVNPVAAFADLWANPRYGLGLPSTGLDVSTLNATATTLAEEGISLSVVLSAAQPFESVLTQLLELIDGVVNTTTGGLLGIGLNRPPSGNVPVVDEGVLLEPPDLDVAGWGDTINEASVKYRRADRQWENDAVTWRDAANFAVTGRMLSRTVEREWITRQDVATKHAMAIVRTSSLPWISGNARVKSSAGLHLTPGTVFWLTYDRSGLALPILCRVLEQTVAEPGQGIVSLRFREDRAHLLAGNVVPGSDVVPPPSPKTPSALHALRIIEAPAGWSTETDPQLLFLPARGDSLCNGFNVWWRRDVDSFTQVIAGGQLFALKGTLNAGLSASGLIHHEGGLDVTFDGPDRTLDETSFDEGVGQWRLMIFIGDEILLGWGPTLTAAGRYTISVRRGQLGTLRQDHAVGATVLILQSGLIEPVTWTPALSPATQGFKVQPYLLACEYPLADITAIEVPIRQRARCPVPPANLRVNGDGVAPTWTAGVDLSVSWTLTTRDRTEADPEVNLTSPADACVLEAWVSGVKAWSVTVDRVAPTTIPCATVAGFIGSATSFELRAFLAVGSLRSLEFDRVTVFRS